MPDENRGYIAIRGGYGLDCAGDILRDRIAIVPVLIRDTYMSAFVPGVKPEPAAYTFSFVQYLYFGAPVGVVEAARYEPHSTERLMSRYMQTQHKNKVGQS